MERMDLRWQDAASQTSHPGISHEDKLHRRPVASSSIVPTDYVIVAIS